MQPPHGRVDPPHCSRTVCFCLALAWGRPSHFFWGADRTRRPSDHLSPRRPLPPAAPYPCCCCPVLLVWAAAGQIGPGAPQGVKKMSGAHAMMSSHLLTDSLSSHRRHRQAKGGGKGRGKATQGDARGSGSSSLRRSGRSSSRGGRRRRERRRRKKGWRQEGWRRGRPSRWRRSPTRRSST